MIVGNGAIAKALSDRPDRLYFAAGVASGIEERPDEYSREVSLIHRQPKDLRFVYFSSLCVFEKNTTYAVHKRDMERLVKTFFPKYTIIRIGNVDFAENPKQLIPFITEKILADEPFEIHDEYKFILSKEEFRYWVDRIPEWNCEMNITGEMIYMKHLVWRMNGLKWRRGKKEIASGYRAEVQK